MQPTLQEWLNRGTRPKKRKPLSPLSKKRGEALKVYAKKRKAFLAANPKCGVWFPVHGPVLWGDLPNCTSLSTDIHHRCGRIGTNYLDETTWIAVCRTCHDWIHRNPKAARQIGLLK